MMRCNPRVANPSAPYRAQNQKNLEIPFSESKNTFFRTEMITIQIPDRLKM